MPCPQRVGGDGMGMWAVEVHLGEGTISWWWLIDITLANRDVTRVSCLRPEFIVITLTALELT